MERPEPWPTGRTSTPYPGSCRRLCWKLPARMRPMRGPERESINVSLSTPFNCDELRLETQPLRRAIRRYTEICYEIDAFRCCSRRAKSLRGNSDLDGLLRWQPLGRCAVRWRGGMAPMHLVDWGRRG